MTLEKFQTLNPLVLCGVLPPQAGSPVCTGDTISFCNNVYVASQTDTCNKITDTVGTILNIDGGDSYAQTAAAHVLCALQQHACTVLAVLAPPRTSNQWSHSLWCAQGATTPPAATLPTAPASRSAWTPPPAR